MLIEFYFLFDIPWNIESLGVFFVFLKISKIELLVFEIGLEFCFESMHESEVFVFLLNCLKISFLVSDELEFELSMLLSLSVEFTCSLSNSEFSLASNEASCFLLSAILVVKF